VPDANASVSQAAGHWQRAALQPGLSPSERIQHIQQGLEAAERALAIDPRAVDALAFKHLLLRLAASLETDAAARDALLRQADEARTRAVTLQNMRDAGFVE